MKSLLWFAILLPLIGCSKESTPPGRTTPPAATATAPDPDGFVPLGPTDFVLFTAPKENGNLTYAEDSSALRLTGGRRGYLHTTRSFRDFTLKLEWRWPNAGELPEAERPNVNTGVLLFISGEDKIWPKCLEVQGKWSELGHIKSNAKDVSVTVHDDQAAREKARKPVSEWQTVEIVAKDGRLTSTVNGVTIAESDPTELREGRIGLQAERFDVEFRNVRIRED